jgi:hypothetical protein
LIRTQHGSFLKRISAAGRQHHDLITGSSTFQVKDLTSLPTEFIDKTTSLLLNSASVGGGDASVDRKLSTKCCDLDDTSSGGKIAAMPIERTLPDPASGGKLLDDAPR